MPGAPSTLEKWRQLLFVAESTAFFHSICWRGMGRISTLSCGVWAVAATITFQRVTLDTVDGGRAPRLSRCGVPSERLSGPRAYPGFHPGLVCAAPLGRFRNCPAAQIDRGVSSTRFSGELRAAPPALCTAASRECRSSPGSFAQPPGTLRSGVT